jgi:hypothetical protein
MFGRSGYRRSLRRACLAALAAGAALAFGSAASADVVGGEPFILNSGSSSVSFVGGNMLITTPVFCSSGAMHVQVPVVPTPGAQWEYWWPQVNTLATAVYDGSVFSTGPMFAVNLSTGQQFYLDNGTWRAPYKSLELLVTPSQHATYAVDDWFQFLDANGRVISQWRDNGFRSSLAYSGPAATSYAYVEGNCLY